MTVLRYTRSDELEPVTITWYEPDGTLYDFSSGWTFRARIGNGSGFLVEKTTGFTGAATAPNLQLDFTAGELDGVASGSYHLDVQATLGATSQSITRTWMFQVLAGVGTDTLPQSPTSLAVLGDLTVDGTINGGTIPTGSIAADNLQDVIESVSGVLSLDIRNYGATTSAARAGIQLALDTAAFGALAGLTAVVYVPPGTWQLDGKINIPNNTTLRGAGDKSIIKGASGIDADVIGKGNNGLEELIENITIENLVIDGNIYNQPHSDFRHGIVFATEMLIRNLRLRNLIIRNCSHYGIGLQGNDFTGENITIENVYIENVGGDAFDCKSQTTRNCFITNFTAHYWGVLDAEGPGVIQCALDLRGTWVVTGVHLRSLANDKMAGDDNHGVRLRPGAVRAGSIGNVVRGLTVAATGSQTDRAVFTHSGAVNQYAPTGNSVDTPNFTRPVVVEHTEGFNATDATSYQTANVSPEPLTLLLLAVASNPVTGNHVDNLPTITGCGLTWTQVVIGPGTAVNNGIALFRAMGFPDAPPTAGQITISFSATQANCAWRLDAVENVSLISSADAIVQSVASSQVNSTAVSATLAALNHTQNGVYSVWMGHGTATIPDTETGYKRTVGTTNGARTMLTGWRPDNDTTPGLTAASSILMYGVAVELRAART